MDYKTELGKILGPEVTKKVKELSDKWKKFNAAPLNQAAPTTPPAPGQPPAPDQVQLQEATLTDGTVIKYNTPTLAAGSEVTIVSPEGEMPAPEGELTLQDGTVIKVVNQDGKSVVESVTPGSGAPAAPVLQEAADNLNSKILEIANLLKGFESKFSAQEKENDSLRKLIEDSKKEATELKTNVAAFLTAFTSVLEVPTAEPIELPKNKKVRPIDGFIALANKKQTQK